MKYFKLFENFIAEAASKAPQGVLFLEPNKVLIGDNHRDAVELSQDLYDKIVDLANQYGYYGEGSGIEYNKGVTKSKIYKQFKNSAAKYLGSWDDKIVIPADKKYAYIYALFSNPTENDRVPKLMSKLEPGETIFDLLNRTYDDWTQPGLGLTSEDLKRFLQEMSEKGYDFYELSQQPVTRERLQIFIDAGDKLMWPDNWEEYPNKAGKLARQETIIRDTWLIQKAPAGVYFIGSGHLLDIAKMTGKSIIGGEAAG